MSLNELSITDAARKINNGEISSEELVQSHLDQAANIDGVVQAWAHLDSEKALEQARMRDAMRMQGAATGPLHGIPIAIKDIIDTAHVPTEYGSELYAGRVPVTDAAVVESLRNAGAVIMGKTVTAELATCGPGKTKNPHNPEHTPGGSSSGSAAAVASFMAPGALGTQTGGSVIRPASFCGIYGFKPTYGMIPRRGILMQSFSHDQVGTFARSLEDIALLTEQLFGYDPADEATSPLNARLPLSDTVATEPPVGVKLAYVQTPMWSKADTPTQEAFGELRDALEDNADEIPLSGSFENAMDWHRTVVEADNAEAYAEEYDAGEGKMHSCLREQIERGREVSAVDYIDALKKRELLNGILDEIFDEYDAIVTPATTGEAPKGLETTGDPAFCAIWSFCGVPAISLPLMEGDNGLPLGVQLVGRRGDDARLLRTARWLCNYLST